ncbi:MAG: hypothetical protein A3G23_13685 [Bacteroidetes bacterium RIFCSPLOWO2_12_FULL_37_12]|nr:MAG: hypothetical protein A3G23_13685 [Bacteroidetes bacterium RIFCSPLOWO2_12_FULL_37_12]
MKKLLFLSLIFLNGCFQLRDAEGPKEVNSDWSSPTEPSILMNNLSLAFKKFNSENYQRCFSENFTFTPDPSVSRSNQGVFQSWSKENENEYLQNLKSKSPSSSQNTFYLSSSTEKFIKADSVEYSSRYSIQVFHSQKNFSTQYSGKLIFILTKNKFSEWQISKWTDTKISNKESWTELKLNFSN